MGYSAGIIGAGGIAGTGILGFHDEEQIGTEQVDASHAGGYAASSAIELEAVADVRSEKLNQFGGLWNIPEPNRYEHHQAMLETEDLDVISVCTPTYLHAEHAIDAARSAAEPRLIWCEKPIASSVLDAERMIAACEETGTELLINHSFRFTEDIVRLRELIQEEKLLGETHSVSAQFRMELLRNATHLIDLLIYLLDGRAKQVAGYITGENEAVDALDADQTVDDAGGGGYVLLDDGTFATIDCTIPRNDSSMTLQFIGSNGKLYLNNDDAEWRYWALEDGSHVEATLPGISGNWTWEEDYTRSFANAVEHIVDLLDGETTNRSPGEQARRSIEVIVGMYLSHYTGGQVTIPFEQPLKHVEITSW